METQKIVNAIMASWDNGELGCKVGDFATYTKDISSGRFDGVGYFIEHIPSGEEQILTWTEDCGYVLWEMAVKDFVGRFAKPAPTWANSVEFLRGDIDGDHQFTDPILNKIIMSDAIGVLTNMFMDLEK